MRVLLLSPVRSLDPPTGDVTYTEQLVSHPPPGVSYTTYDVAQADGRLRERYRRATDSARSPVHAAAFAREALINRARRRNILFREGFRHFDVEPGAFDLIHAHVFATAIYGSDIPVVLSNALRITDLYRDAFGRSPARVALQGAADRQLARRTGVLHASFPTDLSARIVVFTQFLKRELVAAGVSQSLISVVPPGIDAPISSSAPVQRTVRLGFIGNWESKGGQIVLDAFEQLRDSGHDLELVIVGSEPKLNSTESQRLGVHWHPRVDRQTLLSEIIPTISLFVYPSKCDGLPLTLLEVMAAGVPVIVSAYKALPEVVDFGRAGRVVDSYGSSDYAAAIAGLLDAQARLYLARAGRDHVLARYSHSVTAPALGEEYGRALRGT